jgi:hypothetical protein
LPKLASYRQQPALDPYQRGHYRSAPSPDVGIGGAPRAGPMGFDF